MFVTEEEAKKKWCPEAITNNASCGGNVGRFSTPCIASECMMWRWQNDKAGYCGKAEKP